MLPLAALRLRTSRPALHLALAGLAGLVVLLAATTSARAAESYSVADLKPVCTKTYTSGQTDQRGYLYQACGSVMRIFAPGKSNVAAVQTVTLLTNTYSVAPSPDGSYVYAMVGGGPRRYDRAANGTYSLDATWKLGTYPADGTNRTVGQHYIATDAWGNIYVTNIQEVVKYTAAGKFVTTFGEYMECGQLTQACSWAPGQFYTAAEGVTVSTDGRRVYVSEKDNGRIQEFDYQPNGSYAWVRMWGNSFQTDPKRAGSCAPGMFGAPYDVKTDRWGYVYVDSTSCRAVQKFTADGAYLTTIDISRAQASYPRPHGISVDWNGDIMSGETDKLATNLNVIKTAPPAPVPLSAPVANAPADTTIPLISSISIPATTTTQTIPVTINATDNVGVTKMRFIDENGNGGPWLPFAAQTTTTLSAGYNVKAVTVQVQDAAGNSSSFDTAADIARARAFTNYTAGGGGVVVVPPPVAGGDTTIPVISSVVIPATTTSQTIAVTVNATDNVGVTKMRFIDENGNAGAWLPFAAKTTTLLSAGYNVKAVTVQVADAAGNTSSFDTAADIARARAFTTYSAAAAAPPAGGVKDTVAPTITGISMPASTTTELVTVTIRATDNVGITQIRFADENGNFGAWMPYRTTESVLLTPGANAKALTAQVADAAGNTSALDTTAQITAARAFTNCVPCTPPAANAAAVQAAVAQAVQPIQ